MLAIACSAAALLAGSALAAQPKSHVMDVPLPSGGVAHVEYVGDVAPTVTVEPARDAWGAMAVPGFGNIGRMIEDMNRRTAEMMRRAQQMPRRPLGPGLNIASYGAAPAGTSSVSVVSVSNGSGTCTRTTEVVGQGAGKPPKVTSRVTGDCSGASAPAAPAPLNRT
jgi:hypothetical protein